jgi:hypothetical protein
VDQVAAAEVVVAVDKAVVVTVVTVVTVVNVTYLNSMSA